MFLVEKLANAKAGPEVVMRLVLAEGGFQTFMDTVRTGDVTFGHQGTPVLAVKQEVWTLLGNKALDVTASGNDLRTTPV